VNDFGEGDTFGGSDGKRFLVEAVAGRGGQAEVFRCLDTRLHRHVALKVNTDRDSIHRKQNLRRFEHELRMTSRVMHPHVVQVYDCGELPDGQPYVLLEWMEHGSLQDLVVRERNDGHYIPLAYIRYYATAMAAGLRAAHASQLVHRDVKPDNVLIGKDGVAKLTDFGIAKDLSETAPQLTQIGTTVGTLGFMAAEQLQGLPGPQSDIFSWGVSVFTMLMGEGPKQQIINTIPRGILEEGALDDVPSAFRPVLYRALATELSERYSSFTEVLDALGRIDMTDVDSRPLFGLDSLPALPSNAFVSGATAGAVIRSDGTVPPQRLATFEGTLNPLTGDQELYADTADMPVQAATLTAPPVAETRPQIANAPPVSPPPPQPGPTRIALPPPAPAKSKLPMVIGIGGLLLLALGGGFALLGGGPPAPDPVAEQVAALAYGAAVLDGDSGAALDAARTLPASAATRPSGLLVKAWDALAAGDPAGARNTAAALLDEPDPMGASASLITAAAHRLDGPGGYAAAHPHYKVAAACASCGTLAASASRGADQTCLVLTDCAEVTTEGRARHLAAASILRADGHTTAATDRIREALATPGEATCLEARVLAEFGASVPGVDAPVWAAARDAAARNSADCGAK